MRHLDAAGQEHVLRVGDVVEEDDDWVRLHPHQFEELP